MQFLKLIKKVDLFSLPVNTFYTSRDKRLKKKSYHIYHGSTQGGCITLVFGFTLLASLVFQIVLMFSGDLDIT